MALWIVPAGLADAAGFPDGGRLSGRHLALLIAFLLYGVSIRFLAPLKTE
ncbi:hypothetical protein [Microbacterium oryzae]|nr:hypothetical protein [Microbacterium oryzae]